MLFTLLVLIFRCTQGAIAVGTTCNCNNPAFISTWGDFTPTSGCSGACEGYQTGRRRCFSSLQGIRQQATVCNVNVACSNPIACVGLWSPWSSTSQCDSSCQEIQLRFCIQRGPFGNVRSPLCRGGKGGDSQTRFRSCNTPSCTLQETTTSFEEVTTILQTVEVEETTQAMTTKDATSSPLITTSTPTTTTTITTANAITGKSEKGQTENVKNILPTPALITTGLDDKTLGAILGSVAFVCLAITVIVVVLVVTRRKNTRTDEDSAYSFATATTTIAMTNQAQTVSNESYETVSPTLHGRPYKDATRDKQMTPSRQRSVENTLYQPMPGEGQSAVPNAITSDDGGYLLPSAPSFSSVEPESIYSTIEDNRR